ncbi:PAS domain-containing sensor histidine kinase [Oceanospirillum beijerinckii]|uniref:PAS domain-containing sensor histidine kinase n=1 Tax=Oceanospirillum beijerinckii TaxID=64976 RepID=UPI0003F9A8EF|nr:ATP-binding protein [Oceanospirillum beijerinckii]
MREKPELTMFPEQTLPTGATDEAWIDVIQKMDEVYADLVKYQVEIEEKNQALEEAHQFMASVQQAMSDILVVTDRQGLVKQFNPALTELTGLPHDQLTGCQLTELFCSDQICFSQLMQNPTKATLNDCEVKLCLPGGDALELSLNCTPLFDDRQRVDGLVIVGRPIGELKRAYHELNEAHEELKRTQQQLVHAEKMASLGRLVAGVAHELNNPISFVYGNMHALKGYARRLLQFLDQAQKGVSGAQLQQLAEELRIARIVKDLDPLVDGTLEGAERVQSIVQDLRRFSTGQASGRQQFDLVHTLQTALQWTSKPMGDKLRLNTHLPEQAEAYGHPGQIQQVLMNLVQNAIDAMENCDQPELTVELSYPEQNWVQVQITDSGSGIPEEYLDKLFEPFFTTKPVGQGTGLGLSISYGIVLEHHGQLVATNSVDGGACFTLVLPQQAVEPLISSPAQTSLSQQQEVQG